MVPAAFSPDRTQKQTKCRPQTIITASISIMQFNWKVSTLKEWQNDELRGTKLIDAISRAANSVETI